MVERHPDRARELGVDVEEAAAVARRGQAMLIPYDDGARVHAQAEEFTEHAVWDFTGTAPEQYPLMLHFPYFDLYRKRVVKQADLVLAMSLAGGRLHLEQKARNFDYYEALTVPDSSLSAVVQAVIAAEVGHLELAYDYFAEAALIDLLHRGPPPPASSLPGGDWGSTRGPPHPRSLFVRYDDVSEGEPLEITHHGGRGHRRCRPPRSAARSRAAQSRGGPEAAARASADLAAAAAIGGAYFVLLQSASAAQSVRRK